VLGLKALNVGYEIKDASLLPSSGRPAMCLSWIVMDDNLGFESFMKIINGVYTKIAWLYRIDATLEVIINVSKKFAIVPVRFPISHLWHLAAWRLLALPP